MKIIVKPKQKEEAEYYSDFSGDRFEHDIPEVEMNFSFGYGSKFDDSDLKFHISHFEAMQILELVKSKLSQKTKDKMKETLKESENRYEDSVESRDYDSCEHYGRNSDMYRFFLDINEE